MTRLRAPPDPAIRAIVRPLKPTGFWSYTSRDEEAERGALGELRLQLARQLQVHVGRAKVHIFQDKEMIDRGTDWEKAIDAALGQSAFFIPVLTPGFLHSEWCCKELMRFRAIMEGRCRDDLIFPLHYIDVDAFDGYRRNEAYDPAVLPYLKTLQWTDLRSLRLVAVTEGSVKRELERVATDIYKALYRVPEPLPVRAEAGTAPAQPEAPQRPVEVAAPAAAEGIAHVPLAEAPPTAAPPPVAPPAGRDTPAPAAGPGDGDSLKRRDFIAAAAPAAGGRWKRPAVIAAVLGVAAVLLGLALVPPGTQDPPALPPVSPKVVTAPPVATLPAAPPAPPPAATVAPIAGQVIRDCPTCPEMVLVPAGSFTIGIPLAGSQREDTVSYVKDAQPPHDVRIPQPFYLGKYHVTRGQYALFASATNRKVEKPSFDQTDSDPVVNVSWDDATAYVAWLSQQAHHEYRLPTEAEWEYAARARTTTGSTTARYWGDSAEKQCDFANGWDLTAQPDGKMPDVAPCRDGFRYTSPVGSFKPNAFGLYDMLGNAWQWVQDCYSADFPKLPTNGSPFETPSCSSRVRRGGSWVSDPRRVRAGIRNRAGPTSRDGNAGFRVARTFTP